MAQQLAKHGSEAGYNAHRSKGDMCERCRNAHRVYARQYRPKGKAAGLHYTVYEVIDHLYSPSQSAPGQRPRRAAPGLAHANAPENVAAPGGYTHEEESETEAEERSHGQDGPSLADRFGRALRGAFVPPDNSYVDSEEPPDYIHETEPDEEPASGDWSQAGDDEYVINKAGMILIEDNLGTYMSVVGITLEMIDPYCGPILAENFDNIVHRWAKVIARYPRAAKLFLSKDGGTLMTWIGAMQATWPVLYAVYEHHLAKTVKTDNLGRTYRVMTPQSQNGQNVDATMPPMPEYDYTVN